MEKKTIILFKSTIGEENTFVSTLIEHGFNVVSIKTLEFKYKNLQVLKTKVNESSSYRGIIFTSPRCVYAVEKALNGTSLDVQWIKKQNYVVGPTTYELASNILKLNCFGKDSGNAKNLANLLLETKAESNSPYLYPCGNLASDTIIKTIGSSCFDTIEVYETCESTSLVEDIKRATDNFNLPLDFAVFFSPSGVKAVNPLRNQLQLDKIKIIPIGPTTESCLKDLKCTIFGTPSKPNVESLLAVINK